MVNSSMKITKSMIVMTAKIVKTRKIVKRKGKKLRHIVKNVKQVGRVRQNGLFLSTNS
jgi:hypothetical protein